MSELKKITKQLYKNNEEMQIKVGKLEGDIANLQVAVKSKDSNVESFDRINGNEIENFIREHRLVEVNNGGRFKGKNSGSSNDNNGRFNKDGRNKDGRFNENDGKKTDDFDINNNDYKIGESLEEKLIILEQQQKRHSNAIFNLTRQLSNFDKLHMSMLELLENVESIDNKVDRNFPEFRKEISKLEVQMNEAMSKIALLKEDQSNTRASVKAIGVSVSNSNSRLDIDESMIKNMKETIDAVKIANSIQTSKLHDHIYKVSS